MKVIMENTTITSHIDITPGQREAMYNVLRKILSSVTKTRSGKRISDSLRIELEEDQYEALIHVFAQL